jgi:hypothetical protein
LGTVVKGLLHGGSLTLIYGPPKSGKSFLLTSLYLAVAARDREWMGHKIVRPGPVLYVACEGHAGFWKRLRAAAIGRGWDDRTFPKDFVLAVGRPHLVKIDERKRVAVPHPDDVIAALVEMRANGAMPVAIAIDTVFRSLGAANPNAPDHMNAYLAALSAIMDEGIALAAVHHETKAGGSPVGSVSLTGGADNIILTKKGTDDDLHTWEVEMAKDDAETEPRAFRFETVDVGKDLDGEDQVSCVVVDAGAAPPRRIAKKKQNDQAIVASQLLLAYDRLSDGLATSPGIAGEPVRKVPVAFVQNDLRTRGILDVDDKDRLTSTAKNQFMRAKRELIAKGVLLEKDKFIWRIKQ